MIAIIDVSSAVHGGHRGSPDYRISGFPCGGLRKVLGLVNSSLMTKEVVLCFDSPNLLKKELLPTYKSGRVPDYSVAAQVDLLKEILLDCNIEYYCTDRYEADDNICSVVHTLAEVGRSDRVVIYSDDRDLACCVSPNVEVQGITSNGIHIDYANFSKRKLVSTGTIPYNTILLHKMLYGDTSDNYSGLKIPGLRFDIMAEEITQSFNALIDKGVLPHSTYMNISAMEIMIDALPDSFSDSDKEALKKQARIVFPYLIDVTKKGLEAFRADTFNVDKHLKLATCSNVNFDKLTVYCNALGLNKCRTDRYKIKYEDDVAAFKDSLHKRAKELSSGAMAVGIYKNRREFSMESETIENMQLPL